MTFDIITIAWIVMVVAILVIATAGFQRLFEKRRHKAKTIERQKIGDSAAFEPWPSPHDPSGIQIFN